MIFFSLFLNLKYILKHNSPSLPKPSSQRDPKSSLKGANYDCEISMQNMIMK